MPLAGCAPLVVAGAGAAAVAAHDRRTFGSFVDDQAIEIAAASAIRADEALDRDTHVNITSLNGVVLLSGEAPTRERRDRVLAEVREIGGVRRIVNEIRIAPLSSLGSRALDAWLTTKVKASLVQAEDLDSTQVKVVTEDEAVYLMGLVTRREADAATAAARDVRGVRRVVKLFEYLD